VSLAGYPKDESPCLLGGVIVQLKPETEQLVREEIRSGHFHSVDELIVQGINAWREKHRVESITTPLKLHKRLYDLLTQPPFAGSELNLERQKDYPRPVDL
jgi:Arc/MetJ-type ribon-helix-helix transcriptional regulator